MTISWSPMGLQDSLRPTSSRSPRVVSTREVGVSGENNPGDNTIVQSQESSPDRPHMSSTCRRVILRIPDLETVRVRAVTADRSVAGGRDTDTEGLRPVTPRPGTPWGGGGVLPVRVDLPHPGRGLTSPEETVLGGGDGSGYCVPDDDRLGAGGVL